MKKEDLRLLVAYGEGYYSGASHQWSVAFDVNDYEMLKENVREFKDGYTPYFCELDGKHSEVEGDIEILEDLDAIIEAYIESDEDEFDDSIKYSFKEGTEVYDVLKKAQDFISKFEIDTVYKHKTTGEIINISDYEKTRVVIQKS